MAVLPLELAEDPAMQLNVLHCSSSIASTSEEDMHMCSTSCTYTCTSCMLSTTLHRRSTKFWTCCVGNVLHKYTEIVVNHVCARSSAAFQTDQEISVPLIPCSAFMEIIAELGIATCTHSMLSRLAR